MIRLNMKSCVCVLLLACFCLCLFASCGAASDPSQTGEPQSTESTETTADRTQDNPVRSFAGLYTESQTGAGSIEISALDADSALVAVRWNDGSGTTWMWNMSGTFNPKNRTIRYTDCIKIAVISDPENESITEVCYRDGKGSFSVENGEVRWTDNEEHFADRSLFVLA